MKFSLFLVALLIAASAASAADRVPTPEQADRNLLAAERRLQQVMKRFDAVAPLVRRERAKNANAAWRERVRTGCAPDSDGGATAGSAAAQEYAIETQCTADATLERAKMIGDVLAGK